MGLRRSGGSFGWDEPYVKDREPDQSTDVYGLSLTLKYLLTGSKDNKDIHQAKIPKKILDILNLGSDENYQNRPSISEIKHALQPSLY